MNLIMRETTTVQKTLDWLCYIHQSASDCYVTANRISELTGNDLRQTRKILERFHQDGTAKRKTLRNGERLYSWCEK